MEKKNLIADNKKCLLVEFPNVSDKFAVAFQSWLENPVDEEVELEKLKKNSTLVKIHWPVGIEVKSAGFFNKKLKKLKESDWETRVIKILSFGGLFNRSAFTYVIFFLVVLCNTYLELIVYTVFLKSIIIIIII